MSSTLVVLMLLWLLWNAGWGALAAVLWKEDHRPDPIVTHLDNIRTRHRRAR